MITNRIKKAFTRIPKTITEVGEFIGHIAEKQRLINESKRAARESVKRINDELKKQIDPLVAERDRAFHAVFAFAQPRKNQLIVDTKSIALATGVFGWRKTPPSVVGARGISDEEIIAQLEAANLSQYVRVVKEVDREALLRDHAPLPFIEYQQREEFFVKPKLKKSEGRAEDLSTEVIDA